MFPNQLKRPLLIAHRWLAAGLAPLFLLILLSGAVLAFKPILGTDGTAPAGRAGWTRYTKALGPAPGQVCSIWCRPWS